MTDRRAELAAAIANAIIEASRAPECAIIVYSRYAQQGLASVLAMLLEADPSRYPCQTP